MTKGKMNNFLIGKNSVFEALQAGRCLNKITLSRRRAWDGLIREIMVLAKNLKIPVQQLDEKFFPHQVKNLNHQGVFAESAPAAYTDVDEIYEKAANNHRAFLVLIENVTDPQNLGALMRSAEAAGVDGIIIPKNRACPVTATVHRVSAGACEHLKISRVANLNQVIDKLKEIGLWIFGLDATGEKKFTEVDLKGPLALVVGGEDEGLSALTKKKCDLIISIPLKGKVNSLNTSVAGALVMFEVLRQRFQ